MPPGIKVELWLRNGMQRGMGGIYYLWVCTRASRQETSIVVSLGVL